MQGFGGSFGSRMRTWKPHPADRVAGSLRIVGYVYLALAALSAVAFCLSMKGGGETDPLSVAFGLGVLGSFHLVLAKAADRRREWSKILSVLVAVPLMFVIPLGSIAGLIIIVNALKSWDINPD